eukprot:scaffold44940_cov64-Attheya_sp.AAC.1
MTGNECPTVKCAVCNHRSTTADFSKSQLKRARGGASARCTKCIRTADDHEQRSRKSQNHDETKKLVVQPNTNQAENILYNVTAKQSCTPPPPKNKPNKKDDDDNDNDNDNDVVTKDAKDH